MTLDCFHKFSKLPPDLRLMIWEAALRPSHNDENEIASAMHYFSVQGPDQPAHYNHLPTCKTVCLSPRYIEEHEIVGRDSSYLWDHGMWGACVESRRVIGKRFPKRKWRQFASSICKEQEWSIHAPFYSLKTNNDWRKRDREKENKTKEDEGEDEGDSEDEKPNQDWYRDLSVVVTYEGFSAATQPARDLFIFQDKRRTEISPADTYLHPVYRSRLIHDASSFFRDVAVSPTREGFPLVANVGFFYNTMWTEGIRRGQYPPANLRFEMFRATLRGQFLMFLWLCSEEMLKTKLWLIDDAYGPCPTCQTQQQAEKPRQVFYSYNQEFVEVDTLIFNTREYILATAWGFIYYTSKSTFVREMLRPFNIWDHVGVLAPKNRVRSYGT